MLAKIIGQRHEKIMVQVTAPGIHPIMCRVANVDKKTVSSEYQAKHLQLSTDWNDHDGVVGIDEILNYRGWNA